jgi:hypothetical protein
MTETTGSTMKTWLIRVAPTDAFEFEVEAETEDEAYAEAMAKMVDVEPDMVAICQ